MTRGRLEAFSDGVLAIIITIMVLDLRPPHSGNLNSLQPILPNFISYALSFTYVGIYWSNHHHLFQAVKGVNGKILLANLHLLFWLSMTPFATAWLAQVGISTWPVALYGLVLLLSAIAYTLLTMALISHHGRESVLAKAIGSDFKGKLSLGLYLTGIILAFVFPWASYILYFVVAIIWIIPDRRIERILSN
jgi:uncharacterized membrane protein